MPARIRLSRRAGWRMPENTVKVDRTTEWGNPFVIGEPVDRKCAKRWGWWPLGCPDFVATDAAQSVRRFGAVLGLDEAIHGHVRQRLAGKNLACWCTLCPAHADGKPAGVVCADCSPCHADVLLAMANSPTCTEVPS